ncbi:MAG TPA: ABC transporter permease [Actinocrinis sp.]|nr:ABC transporter permease [Actinocrinis sp.]
MAEPVTQNQVMRSEWIKLRTVRSSWFVLGATVLGIAGIGLLVSYLDNTHWSTMSADDRAGFNPVNQSLIGVNLAELAVGVLGVLIVTGEYTTGMIKATFAAVPRRLPVLVGKAGVLAAAAFAVCLVAVLIAFLGGQAVLGSHGVSLGQAGSVRALLGATLYLTAVGVMGVGLGFLIRSTGGAVATLLAVLLVLPIIVAALPDSRTVERYLPSTAGRAVFIMNSGDAMLSPWVGFGIFLLYVVVVMAGAALALRRRDA